MKPLYLLSVVFILALVGSVIGQTNQTIAINQPYPYQPVAAGHSVLIQYTVIGENAGVVFSPNTTYPHYLNVDFVWISKATNAVLNIHILKKLSTDTYAAPHDNMTYHATWQSPSPTFFKRYPATAYNHALMFYEVYVTVVKDANHKKHTVKSIGNHMVVPIIIQ